MQIQKIQNQPNFKAMHIIRVNPSDVKSLSPEEASKTGAQAVSMLKKIHAQFSVIAPEATMNVKSADKGLFGINFPPGLEKAEDAFMGVVGQVKAMVPKELIDHKMVMNTPKDVTLSNIIDRMFTSRRSVGFIHPEDSGKEAVELPKHRHVIGFHQNEHGDVLEKRA
jgi:hypothetical protein